MIVPTIEDLKSHGLLTPELLDALGGLATAKCYFELATSALPEWYRERLKALPNGRRSRRGIFIWATFWPVSGNTRLPQQLRAAGKRTSLRSRRLRAFTYSAADRPVCT